ncbi:hypothetical protein C8F01DRAFT_1092941 [Mycena amicta]|nr:hypothetical protein C8F01DRAFT_1092941 [Mycena amicta]
MTFVSNFFSHAEIYPYLVFDVPITSALITRKVNVQFRVRHSHRVTSRNLDITVRLVGSSTATPTNYKQPSRIRIPFKFQVLSPLTRPFPLMHPTPGNSSASTSSQTFSNDTRLKPEDRRLGVPHGTRPAIPRHEATLAGETDASFLPSSSYYSRSTDAHLDQRVYEQYLNLDAYTPPPASQSERARVSSIPAPTSASVAGPSSRSSAPLQYPYLPLPLAAYSTADRSYHHPTSTVSLPPTLHRGPDDAYPNPLTRTNTNPRKPPTPRMFLLQTAQDPEGMCNQCIQRGHPTCVFPTQSNRGLHPRVKKDLQLHPEEPTRRAGHSLNWPSRTAAKVENMRPHVQI